MGFSFHGNYTPYSRIARGKPQQRTRNNPRTAVVDSKKTKIKEKKKKYKYLIKFEVTCFVGGMEIFQSLDPRNSVPSSSTAPSSFLDFRVSEVESREARFE